MKNLLKEAAEMLTALKYCCSHELCDGRPMAEKCLDRNSDFTITDGSAAVIEKLMKALENKQENH